MSIEYYNKNADQFINDTLGVDMGVLYDLFEKYLKPGASCQIPFHLISYCLPFVLDLY